MYNRTRIAIYQQLQLQLDSQFVDWSGNLATLIGIAAANWGYTARGGEQIGSKKVLYSENDWLRACRVTSLFITEH